MIRKKHANKFMQNDYDTYGIESFVYCPIECEIPESERYRFEQKHMDRLTSIGVALYNMQPFAGKTRGRPVSLETRKRQSESRKGVKISPKAKAALEKANRGRVFSTETRRKMSETMRSKDVKYRLGNARLTESDALEIQSLLDAGFTLTHIASRYGVGTSTIHRIKKGISWSYLINKQEEGVSSHT